MEEGQPVLKYTTETVHVVRDNDFDRFIHKVYGTNRRHYSIISDQELSNDSTWKTSVEKKELDEYDQQKLKEFQQGKYVGFITNVLLTDCCNQGLIPEGNYVVEVCW